MQTVHVKITLARRIVSVCVILFFFVFFIFDLVKVQIIDGEKYNAASLAISEKTATIAAARGEIVDSNGTPLIYNTQGYTIVFDAAYFPSADEQAMRNEIILSLIKHFEENSLEWVDILPLVLMKTVILFIKRTLKSLSKR